MCKISYGNDSANPLYHAGHLYIGGKEVTELVIPNSVTSIGDYAFENCRGLTSVTIPNSVTSIGRDAFENCRGLTSVTIPNSVTSIGFGAFYRCEGLKKAEFASVEQMCKISYENSTSNPLSYAEHLYIGGKEVTELVIPNSVTSIGEYAFYGCSGLTSVTIPNSVTSIGRAAFDSCEGLKSVAIPNSVTSIGRAAFENCFGLTSVTIPNSVTSIGEYAFCWCYGLTSVTIPNSVTSIGGYAFWWCYGLTSVTIPEGVTSIGDYAFFECSGLTSVTIPESVKSIGEYAFNSCSSLTRVVCYAENPPATGYLVFFRVPLNTAELYVPQSALDKYKNASPWSQFKNIYPISDGGGDDGDINGDLKSAKELVADRTYPYASEDAKNAAQEAMAAVATSPEDAAQKAEALLKAYRQYAESHSMLEGCPGATDMTNYIKNPKAEETINSAVWKTVLGEGSGGSIGFRDDQPWTDDSGNATHRYFDGGNWGASAWDVTFKQDIALPAGRYLLTAMGRSEVDVAMTLFAGDVTAEMAHIGPSGGLFDNGWERTSVEFELQKAATVSIGVRGVASAIHQWMSFSDFRLVQFPNTVVVDGIVYDVKSENLFVNGSFDNGVDGWKTVGYETDAVLYNFVYPEQGGYDGGAYITTYAAGKDSETSIRQSVSVVPGKTYYFSVYTSGKSPNAENYQYNALFKMTDAHTENGVIKEFEWPQGAKTVSTDWSQTKCVFTAESYFVGVRMSWNEGAKFDGFVLYEVAGDASIELALANLDKALAAARAEAGKYNVGNGLFQYPEAEMAPLTRAIAAAQAAYDAAESKEAAEDAIEALNAAVAAFAPAMTLPVADQAYLLSLTTSEGTFRLNMEEGIRIAEEGTPVFLVAQGDGTYALATVKGEYVNYAGGDTWSLAASADAYGWTIAALADGGYTITGKNGLLGTNTSDGNAAGSLCFGNKKNSNGNCIWNIEETETPAPAPEVYAIEIAECKNGSVTANVSEANAGDTVTLIVTPSEGYELGTLTVTNVATNASISVSKDNTFTMPEANVMVSATFISSIPDTPKLPGVKMTYVDYDNPDTPVGEVEVAQAGYNKISNGEVGFGNVDWGCNWVTYISVDASGIDGVAIKSATLTAEVSGSTDSKRNTTWGVGYNTSVWSADMTYNTSDRSITQIGTEFTTSTKSADVFETVTFDITGAFSDGNRTATILVYETAAAGGYIRNVHVDFETADSELAAVKERTLAAVKSLPAGDGLFRYPQSSIDATIAAIEAAQTVEEVEAVEMPAMTLPAEGQAYLLSLTTSEGTFRLNTEEGIKIAEEGTPVFLVAQDNGTYALATVNGEYVNYAGGDTWNLAATADAYGWTIAALSDGGYTITGKNGLLGTNTSDGNAAGSTCYGDKKTSNGNCIWNIEETETPEPQPDDIDAVGADAVKANGKYLENGRIVIYRNGIKYGADGSVVK